MSDCVPGIGRVEPHHAHALRLLPVRLFMSDQPALMQPFGQDEDAEGRQRDAAVAEGSQEPADDVGRGAGGHICVC